VQRATLSEQVAGAIRDFIVASKLAPGDKLPSERELSGYFQVSRTVIREALRSLSMASIVYIHHGKGIFVLPFNRPIPGHEFSYGVADDQTLFSQLLELREILELGAIDLAVLRGTEADWANMRELVAAMHQAIREGHPTEELDLRFHTAILRATKNDAVYRLRSVLTEFFRLKALYLPPLLSVFSPDQEMKEHALILETMERGDAETAKQTVIEALLRYRTHFAQAKTAVAEAIAAPAGAVMPSEN
jgi:GntR family transcriptional regulator, transcriptional repressor for pyruvate dehydrogenase complex